MTLNIAVNKNFEILRETQDWVAVYKPPRLLVHKSRLFQEEANCRDLVQEKVGMRLRPVHRLDRPTSGVLLFAKSRESAGRLSKLFVGRLIRKTYYAVVRGHLPGAGMIEKPLGRVPQKA